MMRASECVCGALVGCESIPFDRACCATTTTQSQTQIYAICARVSCAQCIGGVVVVVALQTMLHICWSRATPLLCPLHHNSRHNAHISNTHSIYSAVTRYASNSRCVGRRERQSERNEEEKYKVRPSFELSRIYTKTSSKSP